MTLKKTLLAVAATTVLASTSAFAASERSLADVYKQCGLGGLIASNFEDKKDNADLIAISTNVTWDLGTTAVISNVSSPDTCARKNVETAAFIFKAYPQLEKEIALGNGDYVKGLEAVSGADMQAVRAEFAKVATTSAFEKLSRAEKASALYEIVMQHAG